MQIASILQPCWGLRGSPALWSSAVPRCLSVLAIDWATGLFTPISRGFYLSRRKKQHAHWSWGPLRCNKKDKGKGLSHRLERTSVTLEVVSGYNGSRPWQFFIPTWAFCVSGTKFYEHIWRISEKLNDSSRIYMSDSTFVMTLMELLNMCEVEFDSLEVQSMSFKRMAIVVFVESSTYGICPIPFIPWVSSSETRCRGGPAAH